MSEKSNRIVSKAYKQIQSVVDRMSRQERDKHWPGVHKSLIPVIELVGAEMKAETPQTEGTGNNPAAKRRRSRRTRSPYGSHAWDAYAPPGFWGPEVYIGSIWSSPENSKTETVTFSSTAQIKSVYHVKVLFDKNQEVEAFATSSGSLSITLPPNRISGVHVRCKSDGPGQVIKGGYSGPGHG